MSYFVYLSVNAERICDLRSSVGYECVWATQRRSEGLGITPNRINTQGLGITANGTIPKGWVLFQAKQCTRVVPNLNQAMLKG